MQREYWIKRYLQREYRIKVICKENTEWILFAKRILNKFYLQREYRINVICKENTK